MGNLEDTLIYLIRYEAGVVYSVIERHKGELFINGPHVEDTLTNCKIMLEAVGVDCSVIDEEIKKIKDGSHPYYFLQQQ